MKKNLFSSFVSIILYYIFLQASLAANTTQTSQTTKTNTTQQSQLPQALITEMSTRETRYHHYLWHNMRDNWNNFTSDVQQQFRDLGWEPPRPAINYFANGTSSAITDNGSGEDFLYMHRQMITKARSIAGNNTDIVTGWKTLPAPGDAEYPVPSAYTIPNNTGTTASTTHQKTDDFYNKSIKPLEATFTDPVQLRKMTLGQLGSRIEFTVHNWLHMRFSNVSDYGYRLGYKGTVPYIDPKWDDPRYNWLGDFYSSQVHPLFWKLHGWVDDRIEDWRVANNLTNITWNGTWTGGPMSSLSSVLNINSTSNTTSTKPSNTSSDTTSTKPSNTTSTKPSNTTSTKPSNTSSTTSSNTTSTKPSNTTSTKPSNTTSTKPSNTTSTKPSNASSTTGSKNTSLRVLASAKVEKSESEMKSMKMDHEEGSCGGETGTGGHDIMEKVLQILWQTGHETSFADDVKVDDFVPEEKKWKPETSVKKRVSKGSKSKSN